MTKYILTLFQLITALNALGQFNQKLRPREQPDSLGTPTSNPGVELNCKPAEFPGGTGEFLKYLSKSVRMPVDARNQKIKGRVVVAFVIDTTGRVRKESVKVIESLTESCDKEAIRVIKNSPRWIPAVDGKTDKKIESGRTWPIFFVSKN